MLGAPKRPALPSGPGGLHARRGPLNRAPSPGFSPPAAGHTLGAPNGTRRFLAPNVEPAQVASFRGRHPENFFSGQKRTTGRRKCHYQAVLWVRCREHRRKFPSQNIATITSAVKPLPQANHQTDSPQTNDNARCNHTIPTNSPRPEPRSHLPRPPAV